MEYFAFATEFGVISIGCFGGENKTVPTYFKKRIY